MSTERPQDFVGRDGNRTSAERPRDFARRDGDRDEDHIRLLMDNVRDYAIFTTDPEGLVSSWHAGAVQTLGFAEDEIIGRSFSAIYTPEDVRDGVPWRELRTALAEGRALNER